MTDEVAADAEVQAAQDALMRFVRNFGLHQPDRTPCGQPLPVSEAHALAEIARDGPLRQVELARRLKLQKSSVSRLVTNLAARGWLHRHAADEPDTELYRGSAPGTQQNSSESHYALAEFLAPATLRAGEPSERPTGLSLI